MIQTSKAWSHMSLCDLLTGRVLRSLSSFGWRTNTHSNPTSGNLFNYWEQHLKDVFMHTSKCFTPICLNSELCYLSFWAQVHCKVAALVYQILYGLALSSVTDLFFPVSLFPLGKLKISFLSLASNIFFPAHQLRLVVFIFSRAVPLWSSPPPTLQFLLFLFITFLEIDDFFFSYHMLLRLIRISEW